MKIVTVQSSGSTVSTTVPDSCVAISAFSVVSQVGDHIGADIIYRHGNAILSADPNLNYSQSANGSGVALMAISDSIFPKIPVSAGERLLVAFEATGSAVIYFDEAE